MADEPVDIHPEKNNNQIAESEDKAKEKKIAVLTQHMSQFSGPLPPPEILEYYNRIIPDGANRILKLVEQQQGHRHHLEKTVVEGDVKRADKGLIFGFIVALIIAIGGMVLIGIGCDISGLVLILGGIATLAGIFVYSKQTRKKELDQNKNIPDQEKTDQSDEF